ncbi:hypothetical protein BUALT_Bualt19G0061300 [Buddleja alternifolia]|uniref:Uncharacterized protein n=1 Tax=Buddleja alternifolia TaxID=168488 RepID=A0AAV6W293_9LAMI|nr:hypothetical protein BUALT_Bualt19G0061300 [Buddleja alternifolia]
MGTATFVDIIVAILLPPLGVFLKFGCQNLNVFMVPGSILDLFTADYLGLSPWNYICYIYHHQVVKMEGMGVSYSFTGH